jgi:DNA-binding transcriptional ArsR family regulator
MRSSPAPAAAVQTAARRFAALGDPTRLAVFTLVAKHPLSVAEVAQRLPVSRPAVSQHLRVLAEAGLVSHEVHGNRHLYRPDADVVADLRGFIDNLWDVALLRFKVEAESLARARRPGSPGAAPAHFSARKDKR